MANFNRHIPALGPCDSIEWWTLGKVTRPYEQEMPEDLPLCGSCLNVDVFPHSSMMIQVLRYKKKGEEGGEKTWDITVNDFCDDCSSDNRNAERRQAILATI